MEPHPQKNIIIFSSDSKSKLLAESACTIFQAQGWKVSYLRDIFTSIDILFDLDFEKFLNRIWKQKHGITLIIIFSTSEDDSKFFVEAVNSVKKKFGKNLQVALYVKDSETLKKKVDFITDNFENIFHWSETKSEGIKN